MNMQRTRTLGVLVLLGVVGACGGPSAPKPAGVVALSVATSPSRIAKPGASPFIAAAAESVITGGDTLIVTGVQLVLKHVEAKSLGDSTPCAGEDSTGAVVLAAGEDCSELEVGPFLFDLPLGGGAARQFSVPVPAGMYGGLEFLIHRVGADADDSAFVADHPDLRDVSIRVTGTFDGRSFVFDSRVTASQEQEFPTPLTVSSGGTLDVTLLVDLSTWFADPSHTALVDPATAAPGQPNEQLVAYNIRRSFHVFRDSDLDGRDDDSHN